MSGNPFRRQAAPGPLPGGLANQNVFELGLDGDAVGDTERRGSKVKKVRIETPPPLSPDSIYEEEPIIRRISNESHEGSPPPEDSPSAEYFGSATIQSGDPFDESSGDDYDEEELVQSAEVLKNTRRNSETDTIPPHLHAGSGIANPFHRTLATMESERVQRSEQESEEPAPTQTTEDAPASLNRPQMDVDAFKRLLLTGDAAASPSGPPDASPSVTAANSSYFTAESSHTEATSSLYTSSPRSSSDLRRPEGEESVASIGQVRDVQKKQKPPPPKPRHGRPVGQPRAPRTVSFTDFSPTEAPSSPTRTHQKPLPPTPLNRANSDMVKPPPVPIPFDSSTTAAKPIPSIVTEPSSADRDPQSPGAEEIAQTAPSMAPEPNPTTFIPKTLTHADPGVNIVNQQEDELSSQPPQIASSAKPSKPPPPPPSRRPGSKSSIAIDANPPLDSSPAPAPSNPLPPANYSSSRSSSVSSRSKVHVAPPPPPRRRGSSKSSAEISLSGNTPSQDLVKEPLYDEPGSTADPSQHDDVLADIDALRAEVEALKARYGKI